MPSNENQRRHLRLVHRAKVQLSTSSESIVGYTKDMSDSGLFVLGTFKNPPKLNEIIEVLVLDIEDALARKVVVKRIEPGKGVAVEFI